MKLFFTIGCLFTAFFALAQTSLNKYSFGVKIVGSGKPMILIPGLKGDGPATYATTVAHYKDHYKCYIITLAGFAGQPASSRDSDLLKGQRDELIAFVKDQHLIKPVLVGFSFGGVLALWMETTAPGLFGKLVDIDGTPFEDAVESPSINVDSLQKSLQKHSRRVQGWTPAMTAHNDSGFHSPEGEKAGFEFLKILVTDTTKIPQILAWDKASNLKATTLMAIEIEGIDLRDAVADIQSPILVLGSWIGWDSLKKEDVERAYAAQFTKAKHCTIVFSDHGKHFLMWDDYDWYINEIDQFLAKKN